MEFLSSLLDQLPEWLTTLSQTQVWAVYLIAALAGVGSLTIVASGIVKLTPSTKDDAWLKKIQDGSISGKILNLVRLFSVVRLKKDESTEPNQE